MVIKFTEFNWSAGNYVKQDNTLKLTDPTQVQKETHTKRDLEDTINDRFGDNAYLDPKEDQGWKVSEVYKITGWAKPDQRGTIEYYCRRKSKWKLNYNWNDNYEELEPIPTPKRLRFGDVGFVEDSSVLSKADGVNHGAERAEGKFGFCANFNNVSDYIEIPAQDEINGNDWSKITLTGWVKNNSSSDLKIMTKQGPSSADTYYLELSDGTMYGGVFLQGQPGHIRVNDSSALGASWTHYGLTYNKSSGSLLLYKNGSKIDGTDTSPYSPTKLSGSSSTSAYIGKDTGYVDDVWLFIKELDSADMSLLYTNGRLFTYTPRARYLFEDQAKQFIQPFYIIESAKFERTPGKAKRDCKYVISLVRVTSNDCTSPYPNNIEFSWSERS